MPMAPTRIATTIDFTGSFTAAASCLGRLLGTEEVVERHVRRDHDVIETDHHLFPALLAETNCRGGIRVVGIVRRIVVPGGAFDGSARRNHQRLRQLVIELPKE